MNPVLLLVVISAAAVVLPVAEINPPVSTLPPVMLALALTTVPNKLELVTVPVDDTVPAVRMLPLAETDVVLICVVILALPLSMLADATILAPLMLAGEEIFPETLKSEPEVDRFASPSMIVLPDRNKSFHLFVLLPKL